MTFIISLSALVVNLCVIIFVHEMGHLIVAKLFKVRVLTFSLGIGKRLWGFQRGGTDYRISAFPLGGFVRLSGEYEEDGSTDPYDFINRPRWQRILVYLAGPMMNALLAWIVIAGIYVWGFPMPDPRGIAPVVGFVAESGPAFDAGIREGDEILRLAEIDVQSWQEIRMGVMESPEKPLPLVIKRGAETLELVLVPSKDPKYEFGEAGFYPRVHPAVTAVNEGSPAAAAGLEKGDVILSLEGQPVGSPADFVSRIQRNPDKALPLEIDRKGQVISLMVTPENQNGSGLIGIGIGVARELNLGEALVQSVHYNWNVIEQTLGIVSKIFRGRVAAKSAIQGPIEIASLSGQAIQMGLPYFLHMMALVSISIGLFNLFPIAPLDGGHILTLSIESIIRRDLPMKLKELFAFAGIAALLFIMVMAFYFDVSRNLPSGLKGEPQEQTDPSVIKE